VVRPPSISVPETHSRSCAAQSPFITSTPGHARAHVSGSPVARQAEKQAWASGSCGATTVTCCVRTHAARTQIAVTARGRSCGSWLIKPCTCLVWLGHRSRDVHVCVLLSQLAPRVGDDRARAAAPDDHAR
jgi:hypothetical protein